MIEDSDVMNDYQRFEEFFSEKFEDQFVTPNEAQIYSGLRKLPGEQNPAGCARHLLFFRTYDAIAEFCFDCYKVEIQLNTVVDLFKLLFLFKRLPFPKNNGRKCFLRPGTTHYSGLIYFHNIEEAKLILNRLTPVLNNNIGENVSMFIKRGCTEYGKAFAELDKDYLPVLKSNDEWKKIEQQFNDEGLVDQLQPVPDEPFPDELTFVDYLSMRTWLRYAKTIGDDSYKKVTESPIEILPDLDT